MSYGKLRRLLSEEYKDLGVHNSILLESPFMETTRGGKYLHYVLLAITSEQIMGALEVAPNVSKSMERDWNDINLQFICPLELAEIKVFKRSRRQALKLCTKFGKTRYFELAAMEKRQIFWDLWCYHTAIFYSTSKFKLTDHVQGPNMHDQHTNYENIEEKSQKKHLPWQDKYLYLGSKREKENEYQPIPVPGLGPTEEIKLLYLKPQYFGCWGQTEHWVQCGISDFTFFDNSI